MVYFITGCAGFIGSNLVNRLLSEGCEVVGYDNFSTGQRPFLERALINPKFKLIEGDLLDLDLLKDSLKGCDFVFHLAANADVRFGTHHPRRDLEQNTLGTSHVLEAMRERDIRRIAFSSTGSIYGEPEVFPTPEDCPFPLQTSLYGASKLAAEALIQAYCEGYDFQGTIFRFVSILGEHYTHGHVFDFYRKLLENPEHLHILGNGKQRKSYLYIEDCLDAMILATEKAQGKINIFNLGTDEYCEVRDSARWICEYLGLSPQFTYEGGDRGWIGDSPFIFLDCSRIRALGWKPKLTIREAILQTLKFLETNQWVLKER